MSTNPYNDPASRPVWAPWRIEYIRNSKDEACFLCENAQSEHSGLVVHRASHCYVLLNQYPYNSGHLLIAPYRHVGAIAALSEEERNETMALVVKATEALDRVMAPEGHNVGFNLGDVAGAGLADHLHCHVVPRWKGDTNFMPVLSGTNVVPEALEETAKLLREAWT